jgi:Cu/Ag efflux pump CusA
VFAIRNAGRVASLGSIAIACAAISLASCGSGLIDFVNNGREAGADRTAAILTSARVRLHPIIMTTFAMIFGMLPLALAMGEATSSAPRWRTR